MNIDEQAELLNSHMYKTRIKVDGSQYKGYRIADLGSGRTRQAPTKVIKELLKCGYVVKTGYYCTAVRGYHTYCVLYKEQRKNR